MEVYAPGTTKKPVARKLFHQFPSLLDTKQKNSVYWLWDDNIKRKEIRKGTSLCYTVLKPKGYTKTTTSAKHDLYG